MLNRFYSKSAVCVMMLVAVVGFSACGGDDPTAPDANQAPSLPSLSTMTMDMSFFDAGQQAVSAPGLKGAPEGTRTNWLTAVAGVIEVQVAIYQALEAPIHAFAAAVHSRPQRQEDGSWLWTYIFVDEDIEFSVFLYGQRGEGGTAWRMEVSTNDPEFLLDHFVWFEGLVHPAGRSGYWQFSNPILTPPASAGAAAAPTQGVPTVLMAWTNPGLGSSSLGIAVIDPAHEDFEDALELSATRDANNVDYHDASADANHNIMWRPDGSGSITSPDYNDGVTACWDTQQFDSACQ